jgi:hypothetical protein
MFAAMNWTTFTCLLAGCVSFSMAAEPAPATPDPNLDPANSAPSTARPRATSAATTAKLNAALPKFSPPAKTDGTTATSTPLREADSPRNGIIRLPQYDVREQKPPKFRERELLTRKGRVDVALRRHPGLRFGPFSFLNARRGLEMLEEEDALDRRREMQELTGFSAAVERTFAEDPATGARVIRTGASK